ncbi:hypothetical protein [Mycobacterium sp.]|uniref:hypothetical protein n=1 Tax=Mycobacterium sp. TaxID=1785 RepID=UPI001273A248|nr:hypothetical protein [Mycobacterium sp.]KAA8969584.1 MAG: hypothetical protein F6Q13_02855 [Mycobacterium sp.]
MWSQVRVLPGAHGGPQAGLLLDGCFRGARHFAGFSDPATSATAGVATSLDDIADDLNNAVSTLSAMGSGIDLLGTIF